MHYIFLKNMIQMVLENYVCPECSSKTNEQSLRIDGITKNGIDIHVHCHSCGAHSQLNAQVNNMANSLLENEHGRKFFEEFLQNGWTLGANMENPKKADHEQKIKDEDIVKVHNELKSAKTIEDLMK